MLWAPGFWFDKLTKKDKRYLKNTTDPGFYCELLDSLSMDLLNSFERWFFTKPLQALSIRGEGGV